MPRQQEATPGAAPWRACTRSQTAGRVSRRAGGGRDRVRARHPDSHQRRVHAAARSDRQPWHHRRRPRRRPRRLPTAACAKRRPRWCCTRRTGSCRRRRRPAISRRLRARSASSTSTWSAHGLWFTPLREALDAFVDKVQERVTGGVRLEAVQGEHGQALMTTLWSGRFDAAPDAAAFEWGSSFSFDRRLFEDDVTGSLAWARALGARRRAGGRRSARTSRARCSRSSNAAAPIPRSSAARTRTCTASSSGCSSSGSATPAGACTPAGRATSRCRSTSGCTCGAAFRCFSGHRAR